MSKITLGILEDNSILRSNIERYFNSYERFQVVFSESSVYNVGDFIDVDFVLLDVHLNNTNSLEYIDVIVKKFPKSIIIVVTGDTSSSIMLKAFQCGAKAFINKPFSNDEVVKTIDGIITNGSYISPNTATMLLNNLTLENPLKLIKNNYELTNKEFQVLQLLKAGYSYKEIASKLNVSYHTVNHHVKKIYMKLGVNSRSELLAKHILNK